MRKVKSLFIAAAMMIAASVSAPTSARADVFGGDVAVLSQILINAIQQLFELRSIVSNGSDTLEYLEGINQGLKEALDLMRTRNTILSPGVLSELRSIEEAMNAVQKLYGRVPATPEGIMQRTVDQSIAEAIRMHNEVFQYTDSIDQEGERIKDYARVVSPQGAGRLTAQSLGVLIHVMNQVLRTNAAILKLQGEQLAIDNRHQKLQSEHFKMQYEGLARAFDELKPSYDLPSLSMR